MFTTVKANVHPLTASVSKCFDYLMGFVIIH